MTDEWNDDEPDTARRVWWYPAHTLGPAWRWRRLFIRGGDEFGNRTLGVRVPGGMVILALNIPLHTKLWDPAVFGSLPEEDAGLLQLAEERAARDTGVRYSLDDVIREIGDR